MTRGQRTIFQEVSKPSVFLFLQLSKVENVSHYSFSKLIWGFFCDFSRSIPSYFWMFLFKIGWKLQSFGLPRVASRLSTIPYRLSAMSTVSLLWQSSGGKLMHQEKRTLRSTQQFDSSARQVTSTFTIPMVAREDTGNYTCVASNYFPEALNNNSIFQSQESKTDIIVQGESSSNQFSGSSLVVI